MGAAMKLSVCLPSSSVEPSEITICLSLAAARGVRTQWGALAVRLLIGNVGTLAVIRSFGRNGTKGFLDDVQGGRCGRERHDDDQ